MSLFSKLSLSPNSATCTTIPLQNFNKMLNSELTFVYAALILADDYVAITGKKILTILKAVKVDVEPYWSSTTLPPACIGHCAPPPPNLAHAHYNLYSTFYMR